MLYRPFPSHFASNSSKAAFLPTSKLVVIYYGLNSEINEWECYLQAFGMSLENHIVSLLRSVSLADSLPNGQSIESPISILNLDGYLLAHNEHMADLLQLKHASGHWSNRCPKLAPTLVRNSFKQTSNRNLSSLIEIFSF